MLPYAKLIELLINGAKEGVNFRVSAIPETKEFDVYMWELERDIPTYEELEVIYPEYLAAIKEDEKQKGPSKTEVLAQQVSDLEIQLMEEQEQSNKLAHIVSDLEITILEMHHQGEGVEDGTK